MFLPRRARSGISEAGLPRLGYFLRSEAFSLLVCFPLHLTLPLLYLSSNPFTGVAVLSLARGPETRCLCSPFSLPFPGVFPAPPAYSACQKLLKHPGRGFDDL